MRQAGNIVVCTEINHELKIACLSASEDKSVMAQCGPLRAVIWIGILGADVLQGTKR